MQLLEPNPLTVWAGGTDLPLRDVVIYDAALGLEAGAGDLLLAVGADEATVITEAAAGGVAAVVVRHNAPERERLVRLAQERRICLLALAPNVGWARITSQLRGALSAAAAELTLCSPGIRGLRPHGPIPLLPEHSLTGFANALADAVGGSVVLFSPQQDVLAASRLRPEDDQMRRQAVLDQHGPSAYRTRLREKGFYHRLWRGDEVVEADAEPEFGAGRRLAIAIRSGEEILGSIWVAEGADGLAPHAATTLRSAAGPACRLLLRHRVQAQAQRFAESVARQLLTGKADLASAAGWLDVNPDLPCRVVSCVLADGAPDIERRLADLLAMHLSAYRSLAVPVPWRGRVDVLFCDGSPPATRIRDLVRRVACTLGHPIQAAIGPVSPTLAEASRSRTEADLVLRVLRSSAGTTTRVLELSDVRATAELLQLSDLIAANPELRCGRITTLLAHDSEHHTCYAESLSAYLDAFGDVNRAASTLNIHPNTLRYRVRRVTEICGLDLDDPDERLMAAIQLRTSMLAEPANSPLPVGALA